MRAPWWPQQRWERMKTQDTAGISTPRDLLLEVRARGTEEAWASARADWGKEQGQGAMLMPGTGRQSTGLVGEEPALGPFTFISIKMTLKTWVSRK